MFGSAILDGAIGLVFVYLILGLACTAINELDASLFRWRARDLRKSLESLLPGNVQRAGAGTQGATTLTTALFSRPLINGLVRKGVFGDYAPSYIPSRIFALALLDLVRPVEERTQGTIDGLKQAVKEAETRGLDKAMATTLRILIDGADNV